MPRYLERVIPEYFVTQLGRQATIGAVSVNPLLFKVQIADFALAEADGRPIVRFRRLLVDFELSSLPRWAWTFSTIALDGLEVLADIGVWSESLADYIRFKADTVLGLGPDEFHLEVRCYGWNAVLGDLDPDTGPPREVGAVLIVTASDQATATKVVKLANPYLLHMPLPGMDHLPSFAFLSSPAEIERGPLYEFLLQHVVHGDRVGDLFRTEITELTQPTEVGSR